MVCLAGYFLIRKMADKITNQTRNCKSVLLSREVVSGGVREWVSDLKHCVTRAVFFLY